MWNIKVKNEAGLIGALCANYGYQPTTVKYDTPSGEPETIPNPQTKEEFALSVIFSQFEAEIDKAELDAEIRAIQNRPKKARNIRA